MSPAKSKTENATDRVAIIDKVRNSLNFFVLVVLVVELTLGGLAAKGPYPLTALYGMFFFLLVVIVLVAWLTAFKREALLGMAETGKGSVKLSKFCDNLSGHWWEFVQAPGTTALSVVEMSRDSFTDTLKMQGRVYGSSGDLLARWDSMATCIYLGERKVFYYWTGTNFDRPNESYGGIGEIHFYESLGDADGFYSDANLADLKSATQKNVTFKRSSDDEEKILKSRDEESVADLVRKKLKPAA